MIISALNIQEDYDKKRIHLEALSSLCKNVAPELAHFYSYKSTETLTSNALKKRRLNDLWKDPVLKCLTCSTILKEKGFRGGKIRIMKKKNTTKEIVIICNVCQKPTSLYHTKRAKYYIPELNPIINKTEARKGLLNSELITTQATQLGHRTLEITPKKKVKKNKQDNGIATLDWKIDSQPHDNIKEFKIVSKIKEEEAKLKQDIEIMDKIVSEFEEKLSKNVAESSQVLLNQLRESNEDGSIIKTLNNIETCPESTILKTNHNEKADVIHEKSQEKLAVDLNTMIATAQINEVKINYKTNSSEVLTKSLYDLFS